MHEAVRRFIYKIKFVTLQSVSRDETSKIQYLTPRGRVPLTKKTF